MKTILFVICVIAFVVAFCFCNLKHIHIFQLNSYRPERYMKWLQGNLKELLLPMLAMAIVLLAGLLLCDETLLFLVGAALFGIIAVIKHPKKAKKPLVYTNRVKRLILTQAVVGGLVVAFFLVCANVCTALIILSALLAFTPAFMLICNYVNQPLEKSINRYYINDAKKMLSDHKSLITIGVTGSYGKTSVKYILGSLLEAKYNVLITPESYNTPLGIVKTIRGQLRATHDIFVCEMGAKNVGDIKEICDIVHPQNGIITSIGPQHLETFKTLDNVKSTKFELADALPGEGMLFLNGEDENIASYQHSHSAIRYGLTPDCDYYADILKVTSKGTEFTVHYKDEEETYVTSLIGAHNVINLVGAIAVCREFGIELHQLKSNVRKLTSVSHRLELINRGSTTIIDDAYNSNPSGAKAALDALALFDGYKIIITPGMIELGDKQDEENYAFGVHAGEVCDFVVLVGKKQTKSIYKGLVESGYSEDKIFVADELMQGSDFAFGLDTGGMNKAILFENDLPDNY